MESAHFPLKFFRRHIDYQLLPLISRAVLGNFSYTSTNDALSKVYKVVESFPYYTYTHVSDKIGTRFTRSQRISYAIAYFAHLLLYYSSEKRVSHTFTEKIFAPPRNFPYTRSYYILRKHGSPSHGVPTHRWHGNVSTRGSANAELHVWRRIVRKLSGQSRSRDLCRMDSAPAEPFPSGCRRKGIGARICARAQHLPSSRSCWRKTSPACWRMSGESSDVSLRSATGPPPQNIIGQVRTRLACDFGVNRQRIGDPLKLP